MGGFIAVFILSVLCAPFIYLVKRRYDLKEKQLTGGQDDRPLPQLEAIQEENHLLRGRIENLESIVCDVDYEINLRLAKLSTQPLLPGSDASPDQGSSSGENPAVKAEGDTGSDKGSDPEADHNGTGPTLTAIGSPGRQRPAVAPGTELAAGDVIGNRYRIERLLGRGGMGAVYLAHDEVLSDLVALKVVSPVWAHDPREMARRFRQEASAARKVSSPNVIRIHDLGEAEKGLLYISWSTS